MQWKVINGTADLVTKDWHNWILLISLWVCRSWLINIQNLSFSSHGTKNVPCYCSHIEKLNVQSEQSMNYWIANSQSQSAMKHSSSKKIRFTACLTLSCWPLESVQIYGTHYAAVRVSIFVGQSIRDRSFAEFLFLQSVALVSVLKDTQVFCLSTKEFSTN